MTEITRIEIEPNKARWNTIVTYDDKYEIYASESKKAACYVAHQISHSVRHKMPVQRGTDRSQSFYLPCPQVEISKLDDTLWLVTITSHTEWGAELDSYEFDSLTTACLWAYQR